MWSITVTLLKVVLVYLKSIVKSSCLLTGNYNETESVYNFNGQTRGCFMSYHIFILFCVQTEVATLFLMPIQVVLLRFCFLEVHHESSLNWFLHC